MINLGWFRRPTVRTGCATDQHHKPRLTAANRASPCARPRLRQPPLPYDLCAVPATAGLRPRPRPLRGHHRCPAPHSAGKTMLAQRLPTILPPLDDAAAKVTAVHSIAGALPPEAAWSGERQSRPHHTVLAAGVPRYPVRLEVATQWVPRHQRGRCHIAGVLRPEPVWSWRRSVARGQVRNIRSSAIQRRCRCAGRI